MNVTDNPTPKQVSQALHANDTCAQTLGIVINHVEMDYAEVSMLVTKDYANGHGFCQGGIITTLADTAFAHACNTGNRITVASGLSIDFIRPAKINDTLKAVAKKQHRGKKTGLYTISIYNQNSKMVAIMSGRSYEIGGSIYTNNKG